LTQIHREPVAGLLETLVQPRQTRASGGELGALNYDLDCGHSPESFQPFHDLELVCFDRDGCLGLLDLLAQRRLFDRGSYDVSREHQTDRFELELLVVDGGLESFKLAAVPAEEIERVGNTHRRSRKREWELRSEHVGLEGVGIDVDPIARHADIDLGVSLRPPAASKLFLRLHEASLSLR
jgi:hypothetical protein